MIFPACAGSGARSPRDSYTALLSENGLKVPLAPNFLATIASNKEKFHAWSTCSSSETFSRSLSPLMSESPRPSQISDRRDRWALIAGGNSGAYCPGSGHFRISPPFLQVFLCLRKQRGPSPFRAKFRESERCMACFGRRQSKRAVGASQNLIHAKSNILSRARPRT